MRVLLISANTEQINMPVLPMGLAHVAAAAENAGHDVRLLNLMTKEASVSLLEHEILDFHPEAIGISVRNIDDQCMQAPKFLLDPVKEIVACCRRLSSSPIILGGAGFSIFPGSTLEFLRADMGIRGEGEESFVMLLDGLRRAADPREIPGIVLADRNGTLEKDPAIARKLDSLPIPAPGGQLSFPRTFNGEKVWVPFQTRRGCPLECSYCSTAAIEGRVLRERSPKLIIESLSRFVDAGFSNFFFVDNTFNLPASYAKEICDSIVENGLDIEWRCILYPWRVDEELVRKMARAGCVEVSLGFESGSAKILKSMNKKFKPDEVRSISEMLNRYEIGRMGFLLLGGPGETRETVLESLNFADALDLESMKLTVGVRIYPQTLLARTAVAEGVISPDRNLLFPTFYLAEGLDGWLQQTVSDWTGKRPRWHS